MVEKYISFGPVTNEDGSLTEFTKQFFGLSDAKPEEDRDEGINWAPTFPDIQDELRRSGMRYKASVPDHNSRYIIIAYHPISESYSTHATGWGNKSLCWGHYDFPDFESARVDALERALHR